jgi:hypothetical protein
MACVQWRSFSGRAEQQGEKSKQKSAQRHRETEKAQAAPESAAWL